MKSELSLKQKPDSTSSFVSPKDPQHSAKLQREVGISEIKVESLYTKGLKITTYRQSLTRQCNNCGDESASCSHCCN